MECELAVKLGIMQPYFLPYIGYWQLLNAVDEYVIYDDVNYIKGGWVNRNKVLIHGIGQYITIELHQASPYKKIIEIRLTDHPRWKKRMIRTIEFAYRKAPLFTSVFPVFNEIVNFESDNLADFLVYSIQRICSYLGITTKLYRSSDLGIGLDCSGEDRVIKICQKLGASEYYNAIGGTELYCNRNFLNNHIHLLFLDPILMAYQQFDNQFVDRLSIIDMMMFCTVEEIRQHLTSYRLKD